MWCDRFVARSSTNYVRTRGFFLSVETLTEHNTVTIMYRECAATIVSSNHKAIGWPWKSRHVTRKRKTTNRRSTNAPLTLSCLTLHNWLWLSPMGKDMAQPCVSQYKWSYLIKIPGLLGTCSYFAVPVCTLSNWKQVDDASFSYLFVLLHAATRLQEVCERLHKRKPHTHGFGVVWLWFTIGFLFALCLWRV